MEEDRATLDLGIKSEDIVRRVEFVDATARRLANGVKLVEEAERAITASDAVLDVSHPAPGAAYIFSQLELREPGDQLDAVVRVHHRIKEEVELVEDA